MAEFAEVMRQWVRVRKATASSAGENVLSVYPLEVYDDARIAAIEKNVMQWAAEHPEPVYPTWVEWLIEKGVIPQKGCMLATTHDPDTGEITEARIGITPSALQPIPADIAEKLGVKPKEG